MRWYPTSNGGMQNGSSVGVCTHCVHVFRTFGADLHAQLALINKISASELRKKVIKGPLLVGSCVVPLTLIVVRWGAGTSRHIAWSRWGEGGGSLWSFSVTNRSVWQP